MFFALSDFDHSLISTQYLGQLCSSSLAFLILLRCYWSDDSVLSSSATFFLASAAAQALSFAASLMLPCIFGAMIVCNCFDSVIWELGMLCCCWYLSSSPVVVSSNKCQSISKSSLFIGGDSLSCPIAPSMRWLVDACVRIFYFGIGRRFLSASSVGLTIMVDLFVFTGFSWIWNFRQLLLCQGIFLLVNLSIFVGLSCVFVFRQFRFY